MHSSLGSFPDTDEHIFKDAIVGYTKPGGPENHSMSAEVEAREQNFDQLLAGVSEPQATVLPGVGVALAAGMTGYIAYNQFIRPIQKLFEFTAGNTEFPYQQWNQQNLPPVDFPHGQVFPIPNAPPLTPLKVGLYSGRDDGSESSANVIAEMNNNYDQIMRDAREEFADEWNQAVPVRDTLPFDQWYGAAEDDPDRLRHRMTGRLFPFGDQEEL